MEPLSLYGSNPKRMRYLKFGHLSLEDRSIRMKQLHRCIMNMREHLMFKMKRYEVNTYGYDREKWPFYRDIPKIVNHIIYHVGLIPVESISIDDIIEIYKMEPAPYDILKWI